MSLSKEIKAYGQYLGYCKVGITSADDFDDYLAKLSAREKYGFLTAATALFNTGKGSRPKTLMPAAQSIIVLLLDYKEKTFPTALESMIGSVYLARCYNPPAHSLNGARLQLMLDYLQKLGMKVDKDVPVPARYAAARAGVSTFGKNNFAYSEGHGSYVIIYTLVVDAELEYDEPTVYSNCPEGCELCQKACPTQALVAPFHLDPHRCIGYNNWRAREIPRELREKLGRRIHGCDLCQQVCPKNAKKQQANYPPDEFIEVLAKDISLEAILTMDEKFYAEKIKPVMYNYIKEINIFKRNAALAMGNSGDACYLPLLEQAMLTEDSMVREYAAWAVGRIGSSKARAALTSVLLGEKNEQVRKEILQSLEEIKP